MDTKPTSPAETRPHPSTPVRVAVSFARMLVLAQRRFSASQRQGA